MAPPRRKRSGRFGKVYSDLLSEEILSTLMGGRSAKRARRQAGKAAFGVHALALAWQALHLRDGHVSRIVLEDKLYGDESDAEALVAAGFWTPTGDGWHINGYEKSNLTREDVLTRSLQGEIDACKRYMNEKDRACSCGHHTPVGDLVGDPVGDLRQRLAESDG